MEREIKNKQVFIRIYHDGGFFRLVMGSDGQVRNPSYIPNKTSYFSNALLFAAEEMGELDSCLEVATLGGGKNWRLLILPIDEM